MIKLKKNGEATICEDGWFILYHKENNCFQVHSIRGMRTHDYLTEKQGNSACLVLSNYGEVFAVADELNKMLGVE